MRNARPSHLCLGHRRPARPAFSLVHSQRSGEKGATRASRRHTRNCGPARQKSLAQTRPARPRKGHEARRRLATGPPARQTRKSTGPGPRSTTGFMAVPDKVAGDKYKQAMMQVADAAQLAAGPARDARRRSGRRPDVSRAVLDPQRPEDDRRRCARASTPRWPRPIPPIRKRPLWWWCDALFMAPPVYADMATITGDKKYLDLHGSRVGHHHRAALRPLKASLLPRRHFPRQAREERRKALLVARQRLGDGRNRARA